MTLQEQLIKIGIHKVKLNNGKTIAQNLVNEVNRLYECIQYYIDYYYDTYKPVVYARSHNYQHGFYAQDITDIKIKGSTISLSVKFDELLMWEDSLGEWYSYDNLNEEFYLSGETEPHPSIPAILMEYGWYAPKLILKRGLINHFTYFKGIHAISKGVADWNRTNKLGIRLEVPDLEGYKFY